MPQKIYIKEKGVTRTRLLVWGGSLLFILIFIGTVKAAYQGEDQNNEGILPPPDRPNIIVIRTDDQDFRSMDVRRPDTGEFIFKNVRNLIANKGVTFTNSFVTTALCCPSRASFLTGQYVHNHGVLSNGGLTPGGYQSLNQTDILPVWLSNAGYYNVHVGKYLNGYGLASPVPPGWDQWYTIPTHSYFNYSLNENGVAVSYGGEENDYSTDVFTQKAVDFISNRAPFDNPFFLLVDYIAPHKVGLQQAVPAPRHANVFPANYTPQWLPSFDENDLSDKPPFMQNFPPFTPEITAGFALAFKNRNATLLAVDEGIGQIIRALSATGELDRTYIFFTSDNGFALGEHRISGKGNLYEEDVRVPLVVRGPGIPYGVELSQLVANIDFAPTLVELAGATAGRVMDGRSLIPLFNGAPVQWRSDLLIEKFYNPANIFLRYAAGIRSQDYVYIETDWNRDGAFEGVELYNFAADACHRADPYQLESQHRNPCERSTIQRLQNRLQILKNCAGAACQQ